MRETDKAARRRVYDSAFQKRYLVGEGIDIGCGEAPLSNYTMQFDQMQSVRAWDISDGDAQLMTGVPDVSYDFVHSSHCLEHMVDAREALRQWVRILKPGGFLIVTVPDEDLYEHGCWPSPFNPDHKWSFTICKKSGTSPHSLNVIDLLGELAREMECERIVQLREQFDESAPPGFDQTLGEAECAIEWVWRKRGGAAVPIKSPEEFLHEGVLAESRQDDAAAEAAYRRACAHSRPLLDAYNNLAHLLTRLKRYAEVEALWREATRRLPDKQVRIFQALYLLQRAKFREGFRIREASISDARRTPTLPEVSWPRWQGERLVDKSVVIWTEFGFGDEIMFSRFAGDLKTRLGAKRVSVLCQDPLYPLLRDGLKGADLVLPVSRRAELPPHDYWVFPHSIPVYRQLGLDTIPGQSYLTVSKDEQASWASRLHLPEQTFKVGLVWQGNPTHENEMFRSLASLDVLSEVLDVQGVTFVSLQKGRAEQDAIQWAQKHDSFRAVGHEIQDFAETAAVIADLDLVISVDTSVAHLAGAMGCPVWLLLPSVCDWRWMLERDDSPWYPSMRLFRQLRLGDWAPVVQRVKTKLQLWSVVR